MTVPSATSRTTPAEQMQDAAIAMRGWQDRDYRYIPEHKALAILDAALSEERRRIVERTGIRITSQQIRDALKVLGHTGTAAEAFVRSAAGAMADILDDVEFDR